jgi:hypothetical protein
MDFTAAVETTTGGAWLSEASESGHGEDDGCKQKGLAPPED